MKIAILCVGRLRERFYIDAMQEYCKRIGRFLPLEVIEVPDLPEPSGDGEALRVIEREGKTLLDKLKPSDWIVALCVDGQQKTSLDFAKDIENYKNEGVSRLVFVIGGSLGLSDDVVSKARYKLSLSRMTFPHQLTRVILAEQLYRAFKIGAGEKYHK